MKPIKEYTRQTQGVTWGEKFYAAKGTRKFSK